MKNIPFVENPNGQCMQANILMALDYFYPDKDFDFDDINRKMKHKEGKWSFPSQAAVALNDLGLKSKAYSSKDIKVEQEAILADFKKAFGQGYDRVIKNINLEVLEYFHKRAKREDIFEVRNTSLEDMESWLEKEYIIIPCIDSYTLHQKRGPFQGHFVMLIKMDKESVWVHDPDKGPNIKYPRDLFKKSYDVPAINDDLLVVFGIKKD